MRPPYQHESTYQAVSLVPGHVKAVPKRLATRALVLPYRYAHCCEFMDLTFPPVVITRLLIPTTIVVIIIET